MHSFEFSIFLIIIVDRFTVCVIFYILLLSYCLMYSFALFVLLHFIILIIEIKKDFSYRNNCFEKYFIHH